MKPLFYPFLSILITFLLLFIYQIMYIYILCFLFFNILVIILKLNSMFSHAVNIFRTEKC